MCYSGFLLYEYHLKTYKVPECKKILLFSNGHSKSKPILPYSIKKICNTFWRIKLVNCKFNWWSLHFSVLKCTIPVIENVLHQLWFLSLIKSTYCSMSFTNIPFMCLNFIAIHDIPHWLSTSPFHFVATDTQGETIQLNNWHDFFHLCQS